MKFNGLDRNSGLGGSDAAAAIGYSPYKSPFDLWQEKTGRFDTFVENDAVYWGQTLEPIIVTEYGKRKNTKVLRPKDTYRHPKHEFLYAHIDGLVPSTDTILECKTTNAYCAKKWGIDTNQIPVQYLIQVQYYMAVLGYSKCDVAVLIGGQDFRIYPIIRNEELIELILKRLCKFWHDHVVKDIAPEATCKCDIDSIYSKSLDEYRNPTDSESEFIFNLKLVSEKLKSIKEEKEKIELELMKSISENKGLSREGNVLVKFAPYRSGAKRSIQLKI